MDSRGPGAPKTADNTHPALEYKVGCKVRHGHCAPGEEDLQGPRKLRTHV